MVAETSCIGDTKGNNNKNMKNHSNKEDGTAGSITSAHSGGSTGALTRSNNKNKWKQFLFCSFFFLVTMTYSQRVSAAETKSFEVNEEGNIVEEDEENVVNLDGITYATKADKCEDMKGKFFIESTGQTKGCGWIGANTLFRCNFPEAKLKCRKTCNLCDENENTKKAKSSVCYDEKDWKLVLEDQEEQVESFANLTCSDLKELIEEKDHDEWCNYHRRNGRKGKSAFEACCFCGGGNHTDVPCNDVEGWSLGGSDRDSTIDCNFVASNQALCTLLKDSVEIGFTGYTAQAACCGCGGGLRPLLGGYMPIGDSNAQEQDETLTSSKSPKSTNRAERRLENDPASCPPIDTRDWTTRQGLGESPGIRNIEFLGIGYDGLRGNPHGGISSELDPGFRARIFQLQQLQTDLSFDQEFTIPLGVEFRYISSCKYDSTSTEISTRENYISSLLKEADMSKATDSASSKSKTKSSKWNIALGGTFKGFGGGGSAQGSKSETKNKSSSTSRAFSKSEKSEEFQNKMSAESTVSFEAKAICTEFQVEFNPYSDHSALDLDFKKALDELSENPFVENNERIVALYRKFLAVYGTHYVQKLVLGAKRVFTTTMSSRDFSDLTRQSVDVSNTLSVQMQEAFSKSTSEQWGLAGTFTYNKDPSAVQAPKFGTEYNSPGANSLTIKLQNDEKLPLLVTDAGAAAVATGNAGDAGDAVHANANNATNANNANAGASGKAKSKASVSASGGYGESTSSFEESSSSSQYDNFSRTKKQSEDALKISKKNVKTTEINFGGLPNAD